ncbi:MAG TPA: sulfite exporter TauE/SafE family protein, partial [Candidatus Corynebacterium intestinavium]|nr:sulfite exporter TauE/SafE family protein [Candidatus Corynebacterium intestinavium]
ASEFLVSIAASAGFIFGLGPQFLSLWQPVAGLLVGGVIAAPIAAWAVSRINPTVLGGLVGLLLVLLNSSRLVTGGTVSLRAVEIGLAVLAVIVLWGVWRGKAGARAKAAAEDSAETATENCGATQASQADVDGSAETAVGQGDADPGAGRNSGQRYSRVHAGERR